MENSVSEKILSGLNNQQLQAAKSISGETLVVAGAGSGKTAVLTRRCAYLIANGALPGSILSLTFTNKAAAEMNQRMRKLLTEIGINLPYTPSWSQDYSQAPLFCTFHSLGVRIVREFGDRVEIQKQFTILDIDDQKKLLRRIIKELNIDDKNLTPKFASFFITQCKQELLTPDKSQNLDRDFLPDFHRIYRRYWEICRENNTVDFDDLILLPYLILRDNADVKKICQDRWLHIQIDEFQDTNTAQFELVNLLYPSK